MVDDADGTLAVLVGAIMVIALSVVMLRIRHRRRTGGWIPWNGLLFAAITIGAVATAHLLGIQPR